MDAMAVPLLSKGPTVKIRNVSSRPREIAATGDVVDPDATVEVDRELGESLACQVDVWKAERPATRSKATAEQAEEDD